MDQTTTASFATVRLVSNSITVIAGGLQFPEGPVAMRDGSVIFAEIRSGMVKRAAPNGALSLSASAAMTCAPHT